MWSRRPLARPAAAASRPGRFPARRFHGQRSAPPRSRRLCRPGGLAGVAVSPARPSRRVGPPVRWSRWSGCLRRSGVPAVRSRALAGQPRDGTPISAAAVQCSAPRRPPPPPGLRTAGEPGRRPDRSPRRRRRPVRRPQPRGAADAPPATSRGPRPRTRAGGRPSGCCSDQRRHHPAGCRCGSRRRTSCPAAPTSHAAAGRTGRRYRSPEAVRSRLASYTRVSGAAGTPTAAAKAETATRPRASSSSNPRSSRDHVDPAGRT